MGRKYVHEINHNHHNSAATSRNEHDSPMIAIMETIIDPTGKEVVGLLR